MPIEMANKGIPNINYNFFSKQLRSIITFIVLKEVFGNLDFHFTCSFLKSLDYKPSDEVGVSKGLEGSIGVDDRIKILENIDG